MSIGTLGDSAYVAKPWSLGSTSGGATWNRMIVSCISVRSPPPPHYRDVGKVDNLFTVMGVVDTTRLGP